MRHDSLVNHFTTVFRMVQDHHWSYRDIQDMVPFERDVFVILLKQWVAEKAELEKNQ